MKTNKLQKTFGILTLAACLMTPQAQAHHYKVDGIYQMTVQIGDRKFEDLVTFKEIQHHKLEGTVTVPGLFTANLTGAYATPTFCDGCNDRIEFRIEAVERGETIRVLYSGEIDPRSGNDGIFFTGVAFDADRPGDPPFGVFRAFPLKPVVTPAGF